MKLGMNNTEKKHTFDFMLLRKMMCEGEDEGENEEEKRMKRKMRGGG